MEIPVVVSPKAQCLHGGVSTKTRAPLVLDIQTTAYSYAFVTATMLGLVREDGTRAIQQRAQPAGISSLGHAFSPRCMDTITKTSLRWT